MVWSGRGWYVLVWWGLVWYGTKNWVGQVGPILEHLLNCPSLFFNPQLWPRAPIHSRSAETPTSSLDEHLQGVGLVGRACSKRGRETIALPATTRRHHHMGQSRMGGRGGKNSLPPHAHPSWPQIGPQLAPNRSPNRSQIGPKLAPDWPQILLHTPQ